MRYRSIALGLAAWLTWAAGVAAQSEPSPPLHGSCKFVKVGGGDTCPILAERCKIKLDKFLEFNDMKESACPKIKEREVFCCGKGKKPDLRPKPNDDGTCFSVAVGGGKLCFDFQEEYYLTEKEINKFNDKKTWGWSGCKNLQNGQKICLSEGNQPLPVTIKGAQCGPQKPGTKRPSGKFDGWDLAKLNPCPLNVCCNIWGNCGTQPEFCTDTTVNDTPGTAKKNTNGCISNCGRNITNNAKGPEEFSHVAYFEAWNHNRDCLHMDVTEIDTTRYTHIHFSFGTVTDTYKINVNDVQKQFDLMKGMKDIKKIISFGGWDFSTGPETIHIFRDGIKKENREVLSKNLVAFVVDNKLDGLDIDLEYPGAEDLGFNEGDGDNYLEFLRLLRKKLPEDKSLSIAAPASYWYLRNYPIKKIAEVVDYIIYMTYDLHGQWDVGNEWVSPGCPGKGTCLRSHVNSTETYDALSMITKAGVPSNKVFVGITSYGRSFKMSKKGCKGPNCQYQGERNKSPAKPGRCTKTGGYISDAEIGQIISDIDNGYSKWKYETSYDKASDSDILVYNEVEWVAYMTETTKKRRIDEYKELNFGGVSDWAVDLGENIAFSKESDRNNTGYVDGSCPGKTWDSLDALEDDAGNYGPECTVPSLLDIYRKMLDDAVAKYDEANDGYDGKFDTYADYMKKTMDDSLFRMISQYDDKGGQLLPFFKCFALDHQGSKDEADEVPCDDKPAGGFGISWRYWFELQDKEGYEEALLENGIEPDWVEFGSHTVEGVPCNPPSSSCWETNEYYFNIPRRKDDIEITNPKDIMEEGIKSVDDITAEFDQKFLDISFDNFDGDPVDVIDVLSVPVYLLIDGVAAMEEVKKMGDKIEEEERKNLIINIITGVLFFIPFVGGALGGLGRAGAQWARFAFAFEMGGSAALSVYELIENPESAPMAILGMIAGAVGVRTPRRYNELATARNSIKDTSKGSMGESWQNIDPQLQRIVGNMCKKD